MAGSARGRREQSHQIHLDVRGGRYGGEVVGEGAGDGLQLLRLGARGHPEPIHLAGDHPGPQTDTVGTAGPVIGRVYLDRVTRDGARGGSQSEVLRGVVPRIDSHQGDQVAEALDENGVEIQARGSWEGSGGKLPYWSQLRNYAVGNPSRPTGP